MMVPSEDQGDCMFVAPEHFSIVIPLFGGISAAEALHC
jgi:hypothetical protein